jgi:2-dehydropantoate 2-reductase
MAEEKLTVGVVGVGAVGTVLAACLCKAGAQVVVSDLAPRVAQVRRDGLRAHWLKEDCCFRVEAVDSIAELGDCEPACILVATKAYVLPEIVPEIATAAGRDCVVISAENGIDTEGELARRIPNENVGRMVVNLAAGAHADGAVHVIWFNPPNVFGMLVDRHCHTLERLVALFNASGMGSELVDALTIKKRAFLKTVLTASLMPMCAVLGLTMREAMTCPATRRLAGEVVREGLDVAQRLGYDFEAQTWSKCMAYLEKGGHHHPSMSVDIRNRQPTEIEFINGKLLEIGSRFGDLELGVNRVLVSLLMALEVRNGTREPNAFPAYLSSSGRVATGALSLGGIG